MHPMQDKDNGFSLERTGGFLANKGARVGSLLLVKALAVIKIIALKLLVIIGFKFIILVVVTLLAGSLLVGVFRGASGAEAVGRYQAAVLAVLPQENRTYLERYAVPWGILEALDITAADRRFTENEYALLLRPIAEIDNEGYINKVSAWNGYFRYFYTVVVETVMTPEGDPVTVTRRVLDRIEYEENWTRIDEAITKRLRRALREHDRTVILAMGVSGTYNEPEVSFALLNFVPVVFGEYAFPVAGPSRVTSPFGAFRIVNGRAGVHRGLDIGAAMGTPLVAVRDGLIQGVFWGGLGGNMVVLQSDDGMRYLYAHLSYRPNLSPGQRVSRGDIIGRVGSTGFSTGPHLHIEFILPCGTRINPAPHLGMGM